MPFSKEFEGEVPRLLISQERTLILLQVLVLHRDVMQCDNHHSLARFVRVWLPLGYCTRLFSHCQELILYQY